MNELNTVLNESLSMNSLLKEIINEALWSPTPDNVQNWIFQIDGSKQQIITIADVHSWAHPVDPHYHGSIIALGGFCEYLKVAASKRNYVVHWTVDWEGIQTPTMGSVDGAINESNMSPIKNNCLKLTAQFTHATTSEDHVNDLSQLYPFLKTRRTDRSAYKKQPIPNQITKEILDTNKDFNTQVYYKNKPSPVFFGYLKESDYLFWRESDVIQSTIQWIDSSENAPKTGFNYRNVGLKKIEAQAIIKFSRFKILFKWALKFGMARIFSLKTSSLYPQSGGFLLFSTKGTSNRDLFEMGRHAIKCWMILAKHGYVAQPLSFASLSCFDLKQEDRQFPLVEKNKEHFKQGIQILKNEFDLTRDSSSNHPAWLFRIGMGAPMPSNAIPSRKQFSDFE